MKKSKVLLLGICAVLLVVGSVVGTLAYLTSQDTVVNTFTVGKVAIKLDEAKVSEDGEEIVGAPRVQSNQYHLVPGMTYVKDPTMTVEKASEASYVRMMVTINCQREFDAIYAPAVADLKTIFNDYDPATWIYKGATRDEVENTVTYEFRYKTIVEATETQDLVLEPLFESITVPGFFSSADMASIANNLKITVVGHAIQAKSFASEDAAWTAFADEIK